MQPDELEGLADPALLLVLADLPLAEPVADVLGDVHVREQGVVLEDRVDVALVRRDAGDRPAGQEDLALGRLLEAGDHPEGRRLAAAGRAEEARERRRRDRQVHPVDRDDVAEPLRDADHLDVRVARAPSPAAGVAARPVPLARTDGPGSATLAGTVTGPSLRSGMGAATGRRCSDATAWRDGKRRGFRSVNAGWARDSNRTRPVATRMSRESLKLYFSAATPDRLPIGGCDDDGWHRSSSSGRGSGRSARPASVTLRELAERAGVTESFLSQVEREVTSPSIASVQRIARALDLGIAELFVDEPPIGRVVRRADRRRIVYPGPERGRRVPDARPRRPARRSSSRRSSRAAGRATSRTPTSPTRRS